MAKTTYHVRLSERERKRLNAIISKGSAPARTIMRANILLTADENNAEGIRSARKIAERFCVNIQTVHVVRKECALKGAEATVRRKQRATPPIQAKITGDVEAHILALSCSTPPDGRSKWTLRLLADKSVELHYIDSISHASVRSLLKKTH